jgi:hypothetical protein
MAGRLALLLALLAAPTRRTLADERDSMLPLWVTKD